MDYEVQARKLSETASGWYGGGQFIPPRDTLSETPLSQEELEKRGAEAKALRQKMMVRNLKIVVQQLAVSLMQNGSYTPQEAIDTAEKFYALCADRGLLVSL